MIKDFKKLVSWSKKDFSHLPWREKRNLYTTLVSEIMLQQTTVGTVIKHFHRFIKEYPNLESLAKSTEEEILIAWKGLGYYRRAKNLRKACQFILEEFQGSIPLTREELLEIPGIGPYTSSALIAIGLDAKEVAIDANLERVLSRYYGIREEKGLKLQKLLREKILGLSFWEKISSRDFNEALMDLGRQLCQSKKVNCFLCPLVQGCEAYRAGNMLELPRQTKKSKEVKHELSLLRIIEKNKDEMVLAYKKNSKEWLSGQYEIPTFVISSTDHSFTQYPVIPVNLKSIKVDKSFKTTITKYKITNYILEREGGYNFPRPLKWLSLAEQKNLSTASLKALKNKNQEEG